VIDGLGEEVALLSEEARIQPVMVVYERLARHAKEPDAEIMVTWQATRLADGSLEIIGFSIAEPKREAESRFLAYRTKTDLRLPFTGRWQVFWGGRTIEQNYHARVVDQRFAYDFLMVKDGSTHRGEGKENGDYYCFGAEIVAPGGGLVVSAENKVPESPPGTKNPKQPLGNHVIIDHGNGEFSFLAHLKEGSVVVSTGDAVEQGQRLGACGNSGNTTEPHLHYHLQNTAVVFKGEGLPAQFRKYMANGELIEMGEPVQGDVIEHAE